jgi:hypothetical protein
MKTKELIELEHKYRMEEIEAKRKADLEVEKTKFDYQLQVQRIRSAEIRKNIDKKINENFANKYWRDNK